MTNLPQLHDWFAGLLTPGQWFFAYIVAFIALFVTVMVLGRDEDSMVPMAFGVAFALPIVLGLVAMALLHFLSFMIYLLFSGV